MLKPFVPDVSVADIPTVDLSSCPYGNPTASAAVIAALGGAAEVYGFVRLVGHNVDPAIVDAAFDAGHRFFALPDDVKRRTQDTLADRGFQPMFDNLREDGNPSAQEGFTMGHPRPPADPALARLAFYAPTPWPALPGFREALETLYGQLFALGGDVLDALGTHLGAAPGFFATALHDTYSHLRINHYPPHEAVAHVSEEGVFAHHDESLLTLLLQDRNSGLQVMGPDGRWIAVEPDPAAIVVNVGKMLRHWTAGRYNAALHRVVNRSGRDRYSIPLFVHPSYTTVVDGAALATGPVDPSFGPIVAGETVYASFAGTRISWKEAGA